MSRWGEQNGGPPGQPGGMPPGWPPGYANGGAASLDPPSLNGYDRAGVTWYRQQVSDPLVFLPVNDRIATQPRLRPVSFVNQTANVEAINNIQVDVPSTVYALTGAAFDTTGAALPAGLDSLDTFRVRLEHNTGDRLVTVAGLGSAILGTAQFPAKIGGCGWMFDRGGTITVAVTPLRNNLSIDVVAWIIEIRGPSNFTNL